MRKLPVEFGGVRTETEVEDIETLEAACVAVIMGGDQLAYLRTMEPASVLAYLQRVRELEAREAANDPNSADAKAERNYREWREEKAERERNAS